MLFRSDEFDLLLASEDDDAELEPLADGSRLNIGSGKSRKIVIRYTPGDENAADVGEVQFETNDPDSANVSIPITVREDSPELILRPNSLDFGRVAVGESKSLEVTLTNIGGFDLDVRNLKVVGRSRTNDNCFVNRSSTRIRRSIDNSMFRGCCDRDCNNPNHHNGNNETAFVALVVPN